MDRVTFIESISGIDYPEMLVHFFDQFIALKRIVEDTGVITVESSTEKTITFVTSFKNETNKGRALSIIQNGTIIIYGKPIHVDVQDISNTDLRFILQ